MVREFSKHQAYIGSRMEHDDMMVVKTEQLNTCKTEPEETREMTISNLLTLSLHKDNN
jgi:hypothetical protein